MPRRGRRRGRDARPSPTPSRSVVCATGRSPAGPDRLRHGSIRPRGHPAESLPVVVFFHGGGFVICDLDSHDGFCRAMCNGIGAVVVSVDYRLAPESQWPAAADDAYAATCWVAQHAREFGGDPDRLLVAGDSSGGNLAAVAALMARDREAPAVAGQLLIYPVIEPVFDTESYEAIRGGSLPHPLCDAMVLGSVPADPPRERSRLRRPGPGARTSAGFHPRSCSPPNAIPSGTRGRSTPRRSPTPVFPCSADGSRECSTDS